MGPGVEVVRFWKRSRVGDEDALRFEYECKLTFMVRTYRVYDYVYTIDAKRADLEKILAGFAPIRTMSSRVESLHLP